MADKALIADTCAWVDYFKPGKSALKGALEEGLLNGRVYICGPILYEIVQGVKGEAEKAEIIDAIGAVEYLELPKELWLRAGELSASLRKNGKTLPFSDILIAALAIEHNIAVLTEDRHFREIPDVKVASLPG